MSLKNISRLKKKSDNVGKFVIIIDSPSLKKLDQHSGFKLL